MNKQAHKNFAVNVLGVDEGAYDAMNAEHEAKNAAIRTARYEYEVAMLNNSPDLEQKAEALDKLLGL